MKIQLPLVVALAASVAACDMTESDPVPKQRDVYTSMEDCIADWGDAELCERQADKNREEAAKHASSQGHSGGVAFIPIFFGPSYSGERAAVNPTTGSRVTPTTQKATSTAAFVRSGSVPQFSSPRPASSTISPSTAGRSSVTSSPSTASRGGFGSTGAAASSSAGS